LSTKRQQAAALQINLIHNKIKEGSKMDSNELTSEEAAEIMRKKYRYRELILSGQLVLPHARAVQLLGPDCVYHLYALEKAAGRKRRTKARRSRERL
jgi:hypothetical protein